MGAGAPHLDILEKVNFDLNILVCGDYVEANITKDLKELKKFDQHEGKPYLKKGIHKYIKGWNYFLFSQDDKIEDNTFNFIKDKLVKEKDYKNIIIFYSGLKASKYQNLINFYDAQAYQNLINFYDAQADSYHPNILIITDEGVPFSIQNLNLTNLNPDLVKGIEKSKEVDIMIHLIEVSAYYNQLGDEVGFPKNILDEELLKNDNKLMIKYSFTFNIALCGKPGSGKSTFINRIFGKKKGYAVKGYSTITNNVVKYISDRYPLAIYDTPGLREEKDYERIKTLIKQKNESSNEEKNRIPCIFYLLNAGAERPFDKNDFKLIKDLINQNIDIYFIVTHAGMRENASNFIGAVELNLEQERDNAMTKLKENIYPVELEDKEFKRFGIKEIFTSLFNKYKDYKFEQEITSNNINDIKSIFLGDIKTKEDLKKKLTALSQRAKLNFKILASTLENSPSVKSVNLSTAVIKVISKIYDNPITTDECLRYIKSHGFTDNYHDTDKFGRTLEKLFESIFYPNGPAAREVESLACSLIEEYNLKLKEDRKFYGFLNMYNRSINFAIDSLQNI